MHDDTGMNYDKNRADGVRVAGYAAHRKAEAKFRFGSMRQLASARAFSCWQVVEKPLDKLRKEGEAHQRFMYSNSIAFRSTLNLS